MVSSPNRLLSADSYQGPVVPIAIKTKSVFSFSAMPMKILLFSRGEIF